MQSSWGLDSLLLILLEVKKKKKLKPILQRLQK